MLKREEATKRLEEIKQPQWVEKRLGQLSKLPEKLRTPARAVLGREPSGKEMDWQKQEKASADARELLRRMKNGELREFFETLLGAELAPYVERGWEMLDHLPYESGYERKAFRAPGLSEVVNERRLAWLARLCGALEGYAGHQSIEWVAAWAPHLSYNPDELGLLLAAAIDAGGETGDRVFEILKESAKGEHETGQMGRHVTRALLTCSRPDAWEFIEKLLLAGQRQEGLRQAILETVDEAHPEAFRRMVRLILDNNLVRFAATVRAVDVWFSLQWDAVSTKVVHDTLEKALLYIEDDKARQKAIAGDEAEQAFLAMWAIAFEDVRQAIPIAANMLKDKREGKRFVAAHLLYLIGLHEAREAALAGLDDNDLRIAARAIDCISNAGEQEAEKLGMHTDAFERLEKLFARAPDKTEHFKPIVWPLWKLGLSKTEVANAMNAVLGDRPPTRLVPYLEHMEGYRRASVVQTLVEAKKYDADTRELLLKLVGDNACREAAIAGLSKCKITEDEARRVEQLLTRKSGDVRRGVINLLTQGQKDPAVLASADRLLAAKDALQRQAGLELLRTLVEAQRLAGEGRERGRAYQQGRPKVTKEERVQLDAILDESRQAETLDDALGLLDVAKLTPPAEPRKKDVQFCTPAAKAIVEGLDKLIDAHREEKVFIPDSRWEREQYGKADDEEGVHDESEEGLTAEDALKPRGKEELLGNVQWGFPSPMMNLPLEKDLARLPLREVWEKWWRERPASMRDKDGLELIRAIWLENHTVFRGDHDDELEPWLKKIKAAMLSGVKPGKAGQKAFLGTLLSWLLRMDSPKGAPEFLLDGMETALAMIPKDKLVEEDRDTWNNIPKIECKWRDYDSPIYEWATLLKQHRGQRPEGWGTAEHGRYFRLRLWWDRPTGNPTKLQIPRDRAEWPEVLQAFKAGQANEADLLEHLLGPRGNEYYGQSFGDLAMLTASKPPKELKELPALAALARRCREQIIEVELKRGDSPTAASAPAKDLRCSGGLDVLARVVEALGKDKLRRSTRWGDYGKPAIFSHLIRTSIPAEADTPEGFTMRMKQIGVDEERLVEVAVYAPQWAAHVERALGWRGLGDAIWWIHAHTRDANWSVEASIRKRWEGSVRQRTPLAAKDLLEGAVDVAWFNRAYGTLGEKRWDVLYEAAKYASSSGGHSRARLFGDAMLAREKKAELLKRIKDKRNQDAVRALGLLPLSGAGGAEAARKDVHERYKVLSEFVRTSRQFGSQRQASEKRAAAIGMENLARTAGYPDPIRLQWAMEAQETRDLAKGPVTAKSSDVAVTLSIDEDGQPQIEARNIKKDKVLASVPPAAKKDADVAELVARRTDLKRTASRVRQSLEQAMCRGDVFSGAELKELFGNPMLSPLLRRIVFVGEGIVGYPVAGAQGLEDFAGKIEPIKKDERLRIAHPIDLLATKKWDKWQHDCFARERVQPFKQVFRELYMLTKTERDEGDISRRYAGHQMNPRQAMALLTSRGWVAAPEEGVFRTFHDIGVTAWLTFQESFYTPAEVEGLTLEGVRFTERGKQRAGPLSAVEPRVFSEVMRDVDLIVSVAHRGGVDPEASASTVEMRAALVRETCDLLKLKNVRVKDQHVLIEGDLASYSVHLGSAVTHRMPGGALFIVAVHSQHRGRIFLPFADDDPKTAEVVSKVLLLARDKEIQDPNLLAQVRG